MSPRKPTRKRSKLLAAFLQPVILAGVVIMPLTSFALAGRGTSLTIVGTLQEIQLTEEQRFERAGGVFLVKTVSGKTYTVQLDSQTIILPEGRSSGRKELSPSDVVGGSRLRIRGSRVDDSTMNASLVTILNIEKDSALAYHGVLEEVGDRVVGVRIDNGTLRRFTITNESEIYVNYTAWGVDALSLLGKEILIAVNPQDRQLVKILRITGVPKGR